MELLKQLNLNPFLTESSKQMKFLRSKENVKGFPLRYIGRAWPLDNIP